MGLYETYHIQQSNFRPYLCMLPKNFCIPGTCDFDYSIYSSQLWFRTFKEKLNKRNGRIARLHAFGLEPILEKYPEEFPTMHFNKDSWTWAWAIVQSRAWGMQEKDLQNVHKLIPVMDLFNHDSRGSMLYPVYAKLPLSADSKHYTDCP